MVAWWRHYQNATAPREDAGVIKRKEAKVEER